jgi:hypothetical protein
MNICKVYKNKIFDDDMEVIAEGYKNILTHKRRSKPIDKNKKYFEAVELQDKDSLRGGLKKGSDYHYDRSY